MSDSFALRQFGISAAAVLALALSACGGGGGGSPAELAAAPASETGPDAASADGDSAAAGAPQGAGEGGGSPPVEPGAEDPGPGVSVGGGPGAGAPAAPGGGSTSSGAAMWHVFGEVGAGEGAAALVTSGELEGLSAEAIATTAVRHALGNSVRADGRLRGYLQSPYPENELWRLTWGRGHALDGRRQRRDPILSRLLRR